MSPRCWRPESTAATFARSAVGWLAGGVVARRRQGSAGTQLSQRRRFGSCATVATSAAARRRPAVCTACS